MILVTGGGGFLGRHIVARLRERGERVRVLGRRDYPDLALLGVECLRGDVADQEIVRRAAAGCRAIFHTAAIPGVWGPYRMYHQANFIGSRNVVEAATAAGVRTLVYTSTPSVVYGRRAIDGGDESLPYPDEYLTAYAATKALAERLVLGANSDRLRTLAIRPHLLFGPGDTQLIPKLIERARAGKLMRVGDGRNLISVSYVGNVADAHLAALDTLEAGSGAAGRAYFVNEPEPVNCWDFINRILRGVGLPEIRRGVPFAAAYGAGWLLEKTYGLLRLPGEPRITRFLATQLATSHWFVVDRARRELGWNPRVGFDEAVELMLADMRARFGASE